MRYSENFQGLFSCQTQDSFTPGHMCMIDYSGDGVCWKNKNDGSVQTPVFDT